MARNTRFDLDADTLETDPAPITHHASTTDAATLPPLSDIATSAPATSAN